ncbi:unnamed protein product, partial [Callosobruchus maculatus]
MTFNYLGIDITSDRKNKYMSTESKIKVYKTTMRPILTYAAETRAD